MVITLMERARNMSVEGNVIVSNLLHVREILQDWNIALVCFCGTKVYLDILD